MAQQKPAPQQSMDEILASIRKIISDDGRPAAPPPPASPVRAELDGRGSAPSAERFDNLTTRTSASEDSPVEGLAAQSPADDLGQADVPLAPEATPAPLAARLRAITSGGERKAPPAREEPSFEQPATPAPVPPAAAVSPDTMPAAPAARPISELLAQRTSSDAPAPPSAVEMPPPVEPIAEPTVSQAERALDNQDELSDAGRSIGADSSASSGLSGDASVPSASEDPSDGGATVSALERLRATMGRARPSADSANPYPDVAPSPFGARTAAVSSASNPAVGFDESEVQSAPTSKGNENAPADVVGAPPLTALREDDNAAAAAPVEGPTDGLAYAEVISPEGVSDPALTPEVEPVADDGMASDGALGLAATAAAGGAAAAGASSLLSRFQTPESTPTDEASDSALESIRSSSFEPAGRGDPGAADPEPEVAGADLTPGAGDGEIEPTAADAAPVADVPAANTDRDSLAASATLEEVVAEMLRPKMNAWLDENLERIAARVLAEEMAARRAGSDT